jgi:hypothetical protein
VFMPAMGRGCSPAALAPVIACLLCAKRSTRGELTCWWARLPSHQTTKAGAWRPRLQIDPDTRYFRMGYRLTSGTRSQYFPRPRYRPAAT